MPARTCVHARVRRRWRRRRPAPVPGSGPGSGSGSGSGSLPGLVLFESGLKGMSYSAIRTKPAPLRIRIARQRIRTAHQRMSEKRLCGWAVGPLCGWAVWTEQLRRFCPNRCNCWDLADENAPPGAL